MIKAGSHRGWLNLYCWGITLMFLCGGVAFAEINADVQFSNLSQLDPHPVTYTWSGKKEAIVDPTHYYTFFYTGSLEPDARVPKDAKIERIPVSLEDWEANYKWIVLKLKYYYQIQKNMPLTALNEMSGEAIPAQLLQSLPQPGMMGQQGMGMQNGMMQNGMMQNGMMQNGMMQNGMNDPNMMQQNGMMQNGMQQNGMMQNGMMQPGMNDPNMMQQNGMMQNGMQQNGMQPGMNDPNMMQQNGMMQNGMQQNGMMQNGMQPGMNDPNMMQQNGMMQNGMQPGMGMQNGMQPGMGMQQGGYPQAMPGMPNGMGLTGDMSGLANGLNGATFDAQAAAEWTFFYDQFVLWQYYCGRQILDKEQELLDPNGPPPTDQNGAVIQMQTGLMSQQAMQNMMGLNGNGRGGRGRRGGNNMMQQRGGMMNQMMMQGNNNQMMNNSQSGLNQNPEVSMLDMAAVVKPGEAGKATIDAMRKLRQSQQLSQSGGGMPGMMGDPAMGGGGLNGNQGGLDTNAMLTREIFNPVEDYLNPDRVLAYRVRYQSAAEQREQEILKSFLTMVTDIEQRELNQEQYEQWLEAKRKELYSFADDWRKADDGDAFTIDNTTFIGTKEPTDTLPLNTVNVNKGERWTPQDILNEDGTLKKPKSEQP